MSKSRNAGTPPFLLSVTTKEVPDEKRYPFTIPALRNGLALNFSRNVTFFVGENGSGKSTILEAIAAKCGFNVMGGNRNHVYASDAQEPDLAPFLRLSWRNKTSEGFFLRAESFFNFSTYLDQLNTESDGSFRGYGGSSLHAQSHGEAFLALFTNRFREGIFLLDEPEAALSPQRQLSFLRLLYDLERTNRAQFLIATHSPLLFSYPDATIFSVGDNIKNVCYRETEHYLLMKRFLDAPERYFHHLFSDEDSANS